MSIISAFSTGSNVRSDAVPAADVLATYHMIRSGNGKLNITLFPGHGWANGEVRPWIIS
jgi:hypothetical protein